MTKEERYWAKHKVENNLIYQRCGKCEVWKVENIENYYLRNKSNPELGFTSECRICASLRSQKWQIDNDDKYREIIKMRDRNHTEKRLSNWRNTSRKRRLEGKQKEWRQSNPDKVKENSKKRSIKNHKISDEEWDFCRLYFNYRCAYCGKTWEQNYLETRKDLHRDHRKHDGANDLSNCIPACNSCNSHKWKFDFDEWYSFKNSVFSHERLTKIKQWTEADHLLLEKKKLRGVI